jgi:hypothetical protein
MIMLHIQNISHVSTGVRIPPDGTLWFYVTIDAFFPHILWWFVTMYFDTPILYIQTHIYIKYTTCIVSNIHIKRYILI